MERARSGFRPGRLVWTAVILAILALCLPAPAHAYRLGFKEQLYRLYHQHLKSESLDIAENIHWLEECLRADFANPLNALAVIHNKTEWEKYRYLFMMHLNLKLVESYLQWGSQFNKQEAYFYNAPWQQLNLESLDKAEKLFRYSLNYWEDAKAYAKKLEAFKWTELPAVQAWEDEQYRIATGDLDYQAIVEKHLGKLEQVRQTFKNMDAKTY